MKVGFGESSLTCYNLIREINRGAYGIVYEAIQKETKEVVAIKKFHFELESEGFPSTSIREISLLREIDNQNVIQYSSGNAA